MIKRIVFVLISAIAILAGCKKSNPSPSASIVGKWYFTSIRVQMFVQQTEPVLDTTYTNLTGLYFQFNSDGTGVDYDPMRLAVSEDFTWSVSGNQETETPASTEIPMVYTIGINGSTMTRHTNYTLLNGYTYIVDDVMHK